MFVYFTHNTLQVCREVNPIFIHSIHWDLIIAWTWTNRSSIWTHLDAFGMPVLKKSFSPSDEPCRWTLLHILWWTLPTILVAFCLRLSRNVFKVITSFLGRMGSFKFDQYTFWTHKHPDRRPFSISLYPFTDLTVTVMQVSCSVFEQLVIRVQCLTHGRL